MGLPLTTENKAKAMRCLLKNSKLNGMGFYEVNGDNPISYLKKIFPEAASQEIYNLLGAMNNEHIVSDSSTGYESFTYKSGFLEKLDADRKIKRDGHIKTLVDMIIGAAITIIVEAIAKKCGWI